MIIREFGDSGNTTAVTVPDNATVFIAGDIHVAWVGMVIDERCVCIYGEFETTPAYGSSVDVWVRSRKQKEGESI